MAEQDVLNKIDDVLDKIEDVIELINDKYDDLAGKLANQVLKTTCPVCDGVGTKTDYPGPAIPGQPTPPPVVSNCTKCNGTGFVIGGSVSS